MQFIWLNYITKAYYCFIFSYNLNKKAIRISCFSHFIFIFIGVFYLRFLNWNWIFVSLPFSNVFFFCCCFVQIFFFKFLRWLLLSDHNTYKRQLLPILCLWSPFFICWQMNWNRNFFNNRYLNMHWNMLHNWNMFIHWNSLDVMMMYVMGMHIIWNMNDNMLTKNQLKNNNWREENRRKTKKFN